MGFLQSSFYRHLFITMIYLMTHVIEVLDIESIISSYEYIYPPTQYSLSYFELYSHNISFNNFNF